MSARPARHVVIFARRPQYGRGKRRLAAGAGELAAWRFQRLALGALLRRAASDPRWRAWLAITPDRARLPTPGVEILPQGPGDLGRRLERLMRRLPPGPVVIIGSDAPQVRREDLAAAFRQLGRAEAVFGPAADGGYWLVGLSSARRRRPPFANVRWSTPDALGDTLRNLAGRPIAMLRELEDVDEAAALARLEPGWFRRP